MSSIHGRKRVGSPRYVLLCVVAATAAVVLAAAAVSSGNATRNAGRAVTQIQPIDPSCTSASPCIEYDNNGTGPGIRGISLGGNGLAGATQWNSTSLSNGREGLIGNDISSSGTFNAGVRGLSVRGSGVAGQSSNGAGVAGTSTSLFGVSGNSTNFNGGSFSGAADGVFATSTNGTGIEGQARGTDPSFGGVQGDNNSMTIAVRAKGSGGPLFVGNNSHSVDVFKVDNAGNTIIAGNLTVPGAGVGQTSNVGSMSVNSAQAALVGIQASAGGQAIGSSFAGVEAVNNKTAVAFYANGIGSDLFDGDNSSMNRVFSVLDNGNVKIAGEIFTAGTCSTGCARDPNKPGSRVVTYVPHEAAPISEDVGEAQLTSGRAYVRLDPQFANIIDQRSSYLVFVTPEGDTRGLYVTQKSPTGFAVYENHAGSSNIAFTYRIVAKPFGSDQARLARIVLPSHARYLGR